MRYVAQNIWTGAPICTIDSRGLIQVQHSTCNSEMVETLLERQNVLYKEIVESEEEDIARPLKTRVRFFIFT